MKRRVVLSSGRDVPMLQFLWKWKVATTRGLFERFFSKSSLDFAYRRILKLNQAGLIKPRVSDIGNKHVWLLTPLGFSTIRSTLPDLAEEAFKSEHVGHDLLTAAVHLGDWLKKEPKTVELFSEQELRRSHPNELPSWIPKGGDRRPDGYWDFNLSSHHRIIALEVEINQKSNSDYEQIAEFYEDTYKIDSVLWVIKNEYLSNQIKKVLIGFSPERKNIHNFVLAEDVLKFGWQAKIFSGIAKTQTISQLLESSGIHMPIQELSAACTGVNILPFLQTNKSPRNTMTSSRYQLGDFS